MKTAANHFSDWEAHVFGCGYGTGEDHTVPAIKNFLALVPSQRSGSRGYDYQLLEKELGPVVTWLLISTFARADIIEYGTSPRYAWLTPQGDALKLFCDLHTAEKLVEMTQHDQDYAPCYPDWCNCDDGPCHNPFWIERGRTK